VFGEAVRQERCDGPDECEHADDEQDKDEAGREYVVFHKAVDEPTNGMRVRISAKRHQVKKMPGNIVSVVENLRGSQRWCWRLEMESRNG